MWKCPKCGREFKKKEQSHYCGEKPKTIDEYILSQTDAFGTAGGTRGIAPPLPSLL